MGYSLAWIAVRGYGIEEALDRQGLMARPERADDATSALSAIPWGDWTVMVVRRGHARLVSRENLSSLSAGGEAMLISVEEHVMYSSAELWRDGHRQWRVEHDAQQSIEHLVADGDLPPTYEAVRARFAAQQDEEDPGDECGVDHYFEIPLELARQRVGFKHDEVGDAEGTRKFIVLTDRADAAPAAVKPWWQFWK